MVSKNIVINASGAKEGGAKTIIESFLLNIQDNNNYYIVVGFDLDLDVSNNVKVIKFSTSGILSLFFSIIGFYYFCFKFKADVVISFMNLNLIFFKNKKITYLHQNKIFTCNSLRMKIYRFITKINRDDNYVCQTEAVKSNMINVLSINPNNIEVVWPSILMPNNADNYNSLRIKFENDFIYCICPIIDINAPHKNFKFLIENQDYFIKNNIKVFVTSEIGNNFHEISDCFIFLGKLNTSDLHYLYRKCDFMLFPSKNETVGLPIFEALYYNCKPVLYDAPYLINIFNDGLPNNVILVNESRFAFLEQGNLSSSKDFSYEPKNEWYKLFKMIENFK
ncbi:MULTISPECIES: glycosyltransferase [unclassified Acinetobacter]|uniref:glycosyltransferase n=1 Tax=unclassified Acinetobacter TaxID=196816 RepID=UPI0015D3FFB7|nr:MULTISPECIES: glycosyltransferase [unclassified Acinetobacter]